MEGGFREQTGQGGEDSRQSFIEAIEREKVENELIASLNDLPDSFFTPLNRSNIFRIIKSLADKTLIVIDLGIAYYTLK